MRPGIMLVASIFLFVGAYAYGSNVEYRLEGTLNINIASMEEILLLPDMSEKMAGDIIAYRVANGPFSSIDDLIQVVGFWYSYIDQLRPYLTLDGETTLRRIE